MLPTIETDDFRSRVLERSHAVPVVVTFGSANCHPCHVLEPLLEDTARPYSGAVDVVRVDVEQSPGLAMRQLVLALPTVKVFRNGASVKRFTGARSPAAVRKFFDDII